MDAYWPEAFRRFELVLALGLAGYARANLQSAVCNLKCLVGASQNGVHGRILTRFWLGIGESGGC